MVFDLPCRDALLDGQVHADLGRLVSVQGLLVAQFDVGKDCGSDVVWQVDPLLWWHGWSPFRLWRQQRCQCGGAVGDFASETCTAENLTECEAEWPGEELV